MFTWKFVFYSKTVPRKQQCAYLRDDCSGTNGAVTFEIYSGQFLDQRLCSTAIFSGYVVSQNIYNLLVVWFIKKNHRGGLQKWLLFFKFEIVHCAATLENSKGLLLLPCCSGLPGCNLTTRSEGFESKCHYFLNLYPR